MNTLKPSNHRGASRRGGRKLNGCRSLFVWNLLVCSMVQLPAQQAPTPFQAPPPALPQKQVLDQMLQIFPRSEPWEKWLRDSGELPPDFRRLPASAYLPNPMRFSDGRDVMTLPQWYQRRQELLRLFQHWVLGSVPPAPSEVRAAKIQTRVEFGLKVQTITLEFGPQYQAKLAMELFIPVGTGPFPVFMTQHNHRAWALIAASRGYIGCVYAGADSQDDTQAFLPLWPEFDWAKLTRRAWAASRCLDYLSMQAIVDRARVALAGHSRNGKTSLIGAAMDDRFSAVISSSSGAGGACSYRLFSESQFGEGIELITRTFPDWLHPRLRFFAGSENRLPVDQPELIGCVAPRPCLISTALNDSVESVWAIEQSYYLAQRVYTLLGASTALNLRYRPGGHETKSEDIEAYLDWLDVKFGRRNFLVGSGPVFPTYNDWLKAGGERAVPENYPRLGLEGLLSSPGGNPITTLEQWKQKRDEIQGRILWGLGEAPPKGVGIAGDYGAESVATATALGRASVPGDVEKRSLNFGNYLAGDLYMPAGSKQVGQKLPAVIWVHPISVSNGYQAGYRRGDPFHLVLARAGLAVFAWDQIGQGNRVVEIQRFYQRYPRWSLLGKTVSEIHSAVDVLVNNPLVDGRRIFLVGYGTGAMAALHACALDDRVAGVISICGFTPMRLDTEDKGTGGIARWSHWLPMEPRLGAFFGKEAHIPYDYHEVLAVIAPRPVLVVGASIDYQNTRADVLQCLGEARKVYDLYQAASQLAYYEANDYNRLSPELQAQIIGQLKHML